MKMMLSTCALAVFAGCATVEMTKDGALPNGDRLLVIQNDGYELLRCVPLWSGELTWNEKERQVSKNPAFFSNQSDTQHLYEMAKKIAEREGCDLVDVTFIDNYQALKLENLYGLIQANDTAISAVLRKRGK